MTLISFPNRFKYRGVLYAPHSQIEVLDSEVGSMRALGATVLQHFDDIVVTGENPEGAPEQDDDDALGDEDAVVEKVVEAAKEQPEELVEEKPTLVIPPATNVVAPRRTAAPKK